MKELNEVSVKILSAGLIEKILPHSTNPQLCGDYITSAIRELVGVKIVALFEYPIDEEEEEFSLVSVCPGRYKSTVLNRQVQQLCRLAKNSSGYSTIDRENPQLKALHMKQSFAIPLKNGDEHVGVLLLLNLLSDIGTEEVLETIVRVSGVLGLIFKNSTLFRHLDFMVKERTEELEKTRQYLNNIVESMPSIMITADESGKIVHMNSKARSQGGEGKAEEIFSKLHISHDDFRESIETGEIKTKRIFLHEEDKPAVHYFKTIYPLQGGASRGAVIRMDDITEQVHMEEHMVQNDKMLSVGSLAAGMAHEINNPLGAMIHSINTLANRLYKNPLMVSNKEAAKLTGLNLDILKEYMDMRDIPKLVDTIYKSGFRISAIVNNMLSFARKKTEKSVEDIVALVEMTISLAETEFDLNKGYDFRKISIQREYDENIPELLCNSSQLQQVILNILHNGAQAMYLARIGNPELHIGITSHRKRKTVSITISDNGPGMDEETKLRIFDPFFTTKAPGEGTGLGLSISYFIINELHGGQLEVISEAGRGTTFKITLPCEI